MVWRHDNEMQRMLRDSIEAHVSANHSTDRVRECREMRAGFDPQEWKAMADLGWTGVLLSEENGGTGLPLSEALPLAEVVGRNLIPEPFVASAIMAATVLNAADNKVSQVIAEPLADGSRVITLAFQEQTGMKGATVPSATCKSGKLVGKKLFVPAWSDITDLLVTCILDGDLAIVFIPRNAEGLAASPAKMSDGSLMTTLEFSGVAVEPENILLQGQPALDALNLAIANGTLALCAQMEGLATAAFDITVDYMKSRVQFNQPISDFQANRFTMVDLNGEIELGGASWHQALGNLDENGFEAARVSISAAKARCSEMVLAVTKASIQYHGGIGFTEEADIGLYLKAALRLSPWLGGAVYHRLAAYDMYREGQVDVGK